MNQIICIDFDGTLIRGNSFPLWIKFVLKKSIRSGRFILFFYLGFILFLRKILGYLDHVSFKAKVDSINYPSSWAEEFCGDLFKQQLASEVMDKIHSLKASNFIVTTAAPACYAEAIPRWFLFDQVSPTILSSHFRGDYYYDNYRKNKAALTLGIVDSNYILFTDHIDDFSLAEQADQVFLCNPSNSCLKSYQNSSVQFVLLKDSDENY